MNWYASCPGFKSHLSRMTSTPSSRNLVARLIVHASCVGDDQEYEMNARVVMEVFSFGISARCRTSDVAATNCYRNDSQVKSKPICPKSLINGGYLNSQSKSCLSASPNNPAIPPPHAATAKIPLENQTESLHNALADRAPLALRFFGRNVMSAASEVSGAPYSGGLLSPILTLRRWPETPIGLISFNRSIYGISI